MHNFRLEQMVKPENRWKQTQMLFIAQFSWSSFFGTVEGVEYQALGCIEWLHKCTTLGHDGAVKAMRGHVITPGSSVPDKSGSMKHLAGVARQFHHTHESLRQGYGVDVRPNQTRDAKMSVEEKLRRLIKLQTYAQLTLANEHKNFDGGTEPGKLYNAVVELIKKKSRKHLLIVSESHDRVCALSVGETAIYVLDPNCGTVDVPRDLSSNVTMGLVAAIKNSFAHGARTPLSGKVYPVLENTPEQARAEREEQLPESWSTAVEVEVPRGSSWFGVRRRRPPAVVPEPSSSSTELELREPIRQTWTVTEEQRGKVQKLLHQLNQVKTGVGVKPNVVSKAQRLIASIKPLMEAQNLQEDPEKLLYVASQFVLTAQTKTGASSSNAARRPLAPTPAPPIVVTLVASDVGKRETGRGAAWRAEIEEVERLIRTHEATVFLNARQHVDAHIPRFPSHPEAPHFLKVYLDARLVGTGSVIRGWYHCKRNGNNVSLKLVEVTEAHLSGGSGERRIDGDRNDAAYLIP